jgi:hypothetical protein
MDNDDIQISFIAGYAFGAALIILMLLAFMVITSGCVTAAKNTYRQLTATPIPTPTPEPTPEPEITELTPEPVPTESEQAYMLRTGGYYMREWHHWFRENANNFGEDLSTWVTVYNYKTMPQYHYYSVSWARDFLQKPEPGMKYLFVFVNMYSDGDDARQYGFKQHAFTVNIGDTMYYVDESYDPTLRIAEFEETFDYAHVEGVRPYGYKITQEAGTGIIRAEEQEILYWGRSNAWDGYIVYQIPAETKDTDIRVHGSFSNLGGRVYWILKEASGPQDSSLIM